MRYSRKIYGFQCDIYGHLNNGNYLQIYEEARAETLEKIDFPIDKLLEMNIHIYVKRIEIDYILPIKLGEEIVIETITAEMSRIKGVWDQKIYNQAGDLCSRALVTGVFIQDEKPRRLPVDVFASMTQFLEQKDMSKDQIQQQLKKLQNNLYKMTPKDLVDIDELVNKKVNK